MSEVINETNTTQLRLCRLGQRIEGKLNDGRCDKKTSGSMNFDFLRDRKCIGTIEVKFDRSSCDHPGDGLASFRFKITKVAENQVIKIYISEGGPMEVKLNKSQLNLDERGVTALERIIGEIEQSLSIKEQQDEQAVNSKRSALQEQLIEELGKF